MRKNSGPGLNLREMISQRSWEYTLSVIQDMYQNLPPSFSHVFRTKVLGELNLGEFASVDIDLIEIMNGIPVDADFEPVYQYLREHLIERLQEQIQGGGTTLFLDTAKMMEDPDLVLLLPEVLELRRDEMENALIAKRDLVYDLRSLWLTAYGFEILNSFEMGLVTDLEGLKKVETTFDNVGFGIEVFSGDLEVTIPPGVSDSLKEYLLYWCKESQAERISRIAIDYLCSKSFVTSIELVQRIKETYPSIEPDEIREFMKEMVDNGIIDREVTAHINERLIYTLPSSGPLRIKEFVLDYLTSRLPDKLLSTDSVYDLVIDSRALLIIPERLPALTIIERIKSARSESLLMPTELYVIVRGNKHASDVSDLIESEPNFEEVYIIPSFPADLEFVVLWLQGLEVRE